jgi:hypothetical protein
VIVVRGLSPQFFTIISPVSDAAGVAAGTVL